LAAFVEDWGNIPQYLLGAGDSYSASCFYFLALALYCIFSSGYLYRLEKNTEPQIRIEWERHPEEDWPGLNGNDCGSSTGPIITYN
jgi:hypothetical protein